MTDQPNPIRVALAILKSQRKRRPQPAGTGTVDHGTLSPVLDDLEAHNISVLPSHRDRLAAYRDELTSVDPDTLTRSESLAYWLNLYNAGALDLAAVAFNESAQTVLRVPGAFDETWATVVGEDLSLNDIEHGKIRRFKDPRIHAGLVCGSASCPTLRYEPYRGSDLERQLDDQMQTFLTSGGVVIDRSAKTLRLSRVFLWYGGDFTRPRRMPTWIPARKARLATALSAWMDEQDARWIDTTTPRIEFAAYDWGLACSIA